MFLESHLNEKLIWKVHLDKTMNKVKTIMNMLVVDIEYVGVKTLIR